MFETRTRLFFFACLKDAAGAALKSAAPAPGSDQQKNWLWLRSPPKSGGSSGSGSWLRNTDTDPSKQYLCNGSLSFIVFHSVVDQKLFIPDPNPALNFPSSGSKQKFRSHADLDPTCIN